MDKATLTSSEQKDIILNLIRETRADYEQLHSLGGSFFNHCDAVSLLLKERMEKHGFTDIEVTNGEVSHTYPDSKMERYGHTWLEWSGFIIDPTRCQFDCKEDEFITDIFDNHPYAWTE